jgi:hypothetical protein
VQDVCQERLALAKSVIDSTALVYDAKRAYDAAKRTVPIIPAHILELSKMLALTRVQGRRAQRALDEHIQEHGCVAA